MVIQLSPDYNGGNPGDLKESVLQKDCILALLSEPLVFVLAGLRRQINVIQRAHKRFSQTEVESRKKSSTPLFNYPQSELESDISCNRFGCRLRSFCTDNQAFGS
jgi:hypothetical protein